MKKMHFEREEKRVQWSSVDPGGLAADTVGDDLP